MDKRLLELAYRFRGRCRSPQDWEDLQQDVYVIYLQHRHKYNPRKSSFRTWCYNYLFKKVLTYVESAPREKSTKERTDLSRGHAGIDDKTVKSRSEKKIKKFDR
jgi:DNA-directed RNA polymerase specialized sigma24 family protein